MKATGVIRKLDQLGRITLPISIRNAFNLPEGAPLEIFVKGDEIVLKAYKPGCAACGVITKNLIQVCDLNICPNCAALIAKAQELWRKSNE